MSDIERFESRMQKLLGERYDLYAEAMKQPPVRGIRINTLKRDNHPISGLCQKPSRYAENGWIAEDVSIGNTKAYLSGCIYSQEPSASFAVTAMDLKPGMKVLDLCAAPGSKSTQIAEALQNQGLLVANEIIPSRAKILKENIERHGACNVIITNNDPTEVSSVFSEYFDAVLCDAPCSGEGMFRKNPDAKSEWSPEAVEACARRQASILEEAVKCLKPGGILIYSTCTFSPEENEQNVRLLLEQHPQLELLPIDREGGEPGLLLFPGSENCRRIYPMDEGEGHFVAKLRKQHHETITKELPLLKSDPVSREVNQFLDAHLSRRFPYLYVKRDTVYGGTAPFIDVRPLKLVRHQVMLGTLRHGRFEPSHALVMNSFAAFSPSVELSDEQLQCYRRGDILQRSCEKGWTAVTVEKHAIGLAKSDGTILKNHYPKAFRIR